MGKSLKQIDFRVYCAVNPDGSWSINTSADITTGIDEYPEVPPMRSGMQIQLTDEQKATLQTFIADVVIPQGTAAATVSAAQKTPGGMVIKPADIAAVSGPAVAG